MFNSRGPPWRKTMEATHLPASRPVAAATARAISPSVLGGSDAHNPIRDPGGAANGKAIIIVRHMLWERPVPILDVVLNRLTVGRRPSCSPQYPNLRSALRRVLINGRNARSPFQDKTHQIKALAFSRLPRILGSMACIAGPAMLFGICHRSVSDEYT